MKAIGLFSGVGGIELGFSQAGIETIWATDFDNHAMITYKANHQNTFVLADISDIPSRKIPNGDIILAGFPCQAFSIAGYRKGFEDERGNTFFQLARVIKDISPKVVFIENVKNLKTHDKGNTYRVIRSTLEEYGYHLHTMVLNASEFGNIPQNRERVYIVGFKDPKSFISFKRPVPIPLVKTINDIVDFEEKVPKRFYYTKDNFKNYKLLEEMIVDPKTVYQWRRVYVRENKSNLCPTLTANMGTGGHNVPLVLTKYGIRKLMPQECFQFQGFPDDFVLPDIAQTQLYKQAGNSVVVPVIKRIAEAIAEAEK